MPRHSTGPSRASTIRPQPATYGGAPLRRVFTDATASDATADDLDGAGRVVGNLLTRGGKHINVFVTKLSLILGGGPRNPLETVLKSLQCNHCSKTFCDKDLFLPPTDASADDVLRALFICSRTCAHCGTFRGFHTPSHKSMSKAGKEFASILRGSNRSSQYNAILYITALSSLLPELPEVLVKHDITRALAVLRYQVEHQPDDDCDSLLAPSHCALAVLGDLEIHSIGKEIVALTDYINREGNLTWVFELIQRRKMLYKRLSPFQHSTRAAIFFSVIIHTGPDGGSTDFASTARDKWPIDLFLHPSLRRPVFFYGTLARHLAHSQDPVLNSMVPAFLLAIREYLIVSWCIQIPYESSKGCPSRRMKHTLGVLQSPDWERWLRSRYRLIFEDDGDFIDADYSAEDTESSGSSGSETNEEDGKLYPTYSSDMETEEDGYTSAVTMLSLEEDNSTKD